MVKIVSDTTSGLPREIAEHLGIALVPQIVVFGEKSYRDDTELDTATFLQLLKASKSLPKTAAPPPLMYYPIFQAAIDEGETVIVIAPSQKVSGTVRSALSAKDDFSNADIRVIDTQTVAGNLGSLAILAAKLAQEGRTADEIVAEIEKMIPRGRTFFVIDTLEYLQKGGRIGGAKALIGELLQVKPILQILDGQVQSFDQERTKKRATARLIEIVEEQVKGSTEPHLCVMQVDALDEADAIRRELGSRLGIQNIPVYELPPAIVVHAGPKTLAIGFFV
jgi:DegV family protein with EDD domain